MVFGIEDITNLGVIFDEENEINNRIISIPRPAGSTDNNTAINLTGKVRKITLSGSQSGQGYSGTDVNDKIASFINDMEDWVNSNVQAARTYEDVFGNTYSVLGSIFRWTRTAPGNRILYVLVLIEGEALSAFNP